MRVVKHPAYERDSPYINAPNWPWSLAGCVLSALHLLFFLIAWMQQAA